MASHGFHGSHGSHGSTNPPEEGAPRHEAEDPGGVSVSQALLKLRGPDRLVQTANTSTLPRQSTNGFHRVHVDPIPCKKSGCRPS